MSIIPLPLIPSFSNDNISVNNNDSGFFGNWFSNIPVVEGSREFFTNMNALADKVKGWWAWFQNFEINIFNMTIDFLKWVYEFLAGFVLKTPLWLFSNEWFMKIAFMFCFVSFCVTIIFGVTDGIKRILNKPYTKVSRILKGMPLVLLGSGFFPLVFEHLFTFLNTLSSHITKIGSSQVVPIATKINAIDIGTLDAIALLGFDIVVIGMMIPLIMQMARRWFDILALGALTPIALSCSLFDDHKGYFKAWLSSLTKLTLFQLYYAIFIAFMGILIFGVSTEEFGSLLVKCLIIIGGLWRMAYPPSIIKYNLDSGADVQKVYRDTKDAVTLKNVRDMNLTLDGKPKDKKKKKDTRSNLRKYREASIRREKVKRGILGKIKNIFK
jgi:hypothetical protein